MVSDSGDVEKKLLRTSQGTLPLLPSGPGGVQALRLRSSPTCVASLAVIDKLHRPHDIKKETGTLGARFFVLRCRRSSQRLSASRSDILLSDLSARVDNLTRTQRPLSTS
jgi:hypothetical protein